MGRKEREWSGSAEPRREGAAPQQSRQHMRCFRVWAGRGGGQETGEAGGGWHPRDLETDPVKGVLYCVQ